MKRFISMLLALVGCLVLGGARGESRVVDAALVVEGYSFGPGVSKILLNLNEPVQSVELSVGAVVTAGVERQIVDVYPCDARAERTDQASAQIAVELSQEELRASTPFAQGELSALSVWAPSYPVRLTGTLTLDGESETLSIDEDLIDRRVCPDSDLFSVRMEYMSTYENPMTSGMDELTIRMAAYEPETLSGGEKNPLLIWLHGHDEGGTDLDIALLGNEVTALAKTGIQSHFHSEDGTMGTYVLIPQTETCWMDGGDGLNGDGAAPSRYTEALMEAIQAYLASNPDVDTNRIYLGGCSNGGYMTVNMLINYPDTFAAAFPVCEAMRHAEGTVNGEAYLDEEAISRLVNESIWFVQSADDFVVKPEENVMPTYRDLIFLGAEDCWISMFASYNHAVWVAVFQDRINGVQDPMVVSEEMRTEPDNTAGGAFDANGYTNLFDWLNAHVLEK